MKSVLALALATAALPIAAFANAVVGQPAPGFTVTDLSGKPVKLEDFKGKTVVLEWHNFGCPFVQKHYKSGNMQSLQKKYSSDVVWLAVEFHEPQRAPTYAEPRLSSAQLEQIARPRRLPVGRARAMGRAYGARPTPHMYIIDPTGKAVYNGAIDDKRSTNPEDVKTSKNFVAAALDEMKAGKPVSVASTAVRLQRPRTAGASPLNSELRRVMSTAARARTRCGSLRHGAMTMSTGEALTMTSFVGIDCGRAG
jgi:hypothetical protein